MSTVVVDDHLLLRVLRPMGELVHAGARLNLLSLEALAAARHLHAELCLAEADDNGPLQAAASEFGVVVRTVRD